MRQPVPIVRQAEDRETRVKRLHAAIKAGDKDNLQRARELGEELLAEREDCICKQRGWYERLEELGIERHSADNYMAIAKAYRDGILSLSDSDMGYSEALIRVREARKAERMPEEYPQIETPLNNDVLPFAEQDSEAEQDQPMAFNPSSSGRVGKPGEFVTLDEWERDWDRERRRQLLDVLSQVPSGSKAMNFQQGESIEWALWSWNPVTGCLHNCPYCYARDIAERIYEPRFAPVLWPGRLDAPRNISVPQDKINEALAADDPARANGLKTVFTCSMADLFGRWVPREWIEAVLEVVNGCPQWNFLFLTKFPIRMAEFDFPDNAWVGTTVDCQARVANAEKAFRKVKAGVKWLSCEPLIEPLVFADLSAFDWIVLGGASKSSQTPEWHPPRAWVNAIEEEALRLGVKVYEKTNLLERVRQYPGLVTEIPEQAPEALRYLPRESK